MFRNRVLLGALLAALFGVGWWAGRGRASADLYANLDQFIEILHAVQRTYVDPVQPAPLVQGGMTGLLRGLDAYSDFLDAGAYASYTNDRSVDLNDIGAALDLRDGVPVVIAPIEGSPAWQAGLQGGDVILKVNGQRTVGLALPEVIARVRGAAGTTVTLSVGHTDDDQPRELSVVRAAPSSRSVAWSLVGAPGLGVLRLSAFGPRAGEEVRVALDSLRARGAHSLVLDLRGTPGGGIESAVAVAQSFLPEGALVAYTRGRMPSADHRYLAARGRPQVAWPMAVLVDGGSASAAEVVAGALQDLDRAVVVGATTFGRGVQQTLFPLQGRAGAVRMTTAYWFTPSGRSIQPPRAGAIADDEEQDAPADSELAHPSRPAFRTRAGRAVVGGGGITPDRLVSPDSLPPVARRAEQQRVAAHFIAAHPGAAPAGGEWPAFVAALRAADVTGSDAAFEAARPWLEQSLRRERARREGGASAAARVALERDPVYAQAARLLARAKAPRDVFATLAPPARGN